jgi:hypothetical protein
MIGCFLFTKSSNIVPDGQQKTAQCAARPDSVPLHGESVIALPTLFSGDMLLACILEESVGQGTHLALLAAQHLSLVAPATTLGAEVLVIVEHHPTGSGATEGR